MKESHRSKIRAWREHVLRQSIKSQERARNKEKKNKIQ